MNSKPVIYVAGPYSSHPSKSVGAALFAAEKIWAAGGIPVVPHLTHFWELIHPHGYEEWMAYDEVLLARCDALVRIPGHSAGADREVMFACWAGMPVFSGVTNCICALDNIPVPRSIDSVREAAFQECFEEQCSFCSWGWPIALHADGPWRHSNPDDLAYPAGGQYRDCEASHLRNLLERKSEAASPTAEASGVDVAPLKEGRIPRGFSPYSGSSRGKPEGAGR